MTDDEDTITIPRAEYDTLIRKAASAVVLGGRVPTYFQIAVYGGSATLRASVVYSDETIEQVDERKINPGDILKVEFNYKNRLG